MSRLHIRDGLSAGIAIKPMTMELEFRYLAKAGLIPRGEVGVRTGDFSPQHVKNVLLGLSAYQPSDAVEAVEALDVLPFRHPPVNALAFAGLPGKGEPPIPRPDRKAFGAWLMERIEHYATESGQVEFLAEEQKRLADKLSPRTITMDAGSRLAWVSVPSGWENRYRQRYEYEFYGRASNDPHDDPPMTRQTTLRWDVLALAGRLLMEAGGSQGALFPKNGKASPATKSKNKKAGLLPGKPAHSATSTNNGTRQDAAAHEGIGSLNTSDDILRVCVSSSGSRRTERTRYHEPREPHHGAGL